MAHEPDTLCVRLRWLVYFAEFLPAGAATGGGRSWRPFRSLSRILTRSLTRDLSGRLSGRLLNGGLCWNIRRHCKRDWRSHCACGERVYPLALYSRPTTRRNPRKRGGQAVSPGQQTARAVNKNRGEASLVKPGAEKESTRRKEQKTKPQKSASGRSARRSAQNWQKARGEVRGERGPWKLDSGNMNWEAAGLKMKRQCSGGVVVLSDKKGFFSSSFIVFVLVLLFASSCCSRQWF